MSYRHGYEIRFADGGVMTLGPRTRVMGVLNVTPDSFSDGGRFDSPSRAIDASARMVEEGADIIDIGGESTRPGAADLAPEREAERVVPVIEAVKARHEIRVSIDTRNASVARRALDAGADMVNDVSALSDPAMLPLICERRVPVVLMHMRGSPKTMQRDTSYDDLVGAVTSFLRERVDIAASGGVKSGKILVDPGIGFGKSTAGNLEILKRLPALGRLGRPILIGASRKTFIGKTLDLPVEQRLEGSLAVAAYASAFGAHVIRAHDVAATVRVVRMVDAIREA
jgi:dihydropteroate synthase